jgi:outer membrane protein assembly factor BamD
MLSRYDAGDFAEVARQHLADCRRKLAEHELYVARFYSKRNRPRAAIRRAEGLLETYAGLGLDAEALWIAAEGHLATHETDRAQAHLRRLVDAFATTPWGQLAANRIKSLHSGAES